MTRPTPSSFPPDENCNERDDDDSDFDVYSEEDLLGTMKTMELRRAAKRRKEGGVNTSTTTAEDDDAIDFDRTLALGKRLEIYMILFLTHFLYYTGSSGWLFIYYVGVIKVLRREGYAEYVFMCRRMYLFLTTTRSLRRGFVSFFRFAKRRSFVLLRERR
jgi:hypothetical protein